MKVPLAPAGRAFCTASANALMFCTRWSAGNDALPTPAWTMPAFSTRNSTEPPLAPFTALVTSIVTVPTLGFGIIPRGPKTLPSRPTSGLGATREYSHADAAARAVRQVYDAAHHLIGVARVDSKIHRDLDCLVELRLGALFDHLHRLIQRIKLGAVDALADGSGAFSELGHGAYPATSMPIERAEPSTIRIAASTVSQFKSFIFCSAISRTCALVTVPARSRPGVFDPLSSFAAFLMK